MTENEPGAPRRVLRTLGKWLKRLFVLAVLGGVVVAIALGMQPKPTLVEVDSVTRGPLTIAVEDDGRTRLQNRYLVSAPLAGQLARITLRPGDRVAEGDVIGRLTPLPTPLMDPQSRVQAEASLAAAQDAHRQARTMETRAATAVEFAEHELATLRGLADSGAGARHDVTVAEHTLRTAQDEVAAARFGSRIASHQVDVARAALSRFRTGPERGAQDADSDTNLEQILLSAPVAGIVLEVMNEHEGVVQAGSPLVEIGDPDAMEIVVDVLTTDAVRIPAGAAATIERWGGETALNANVRRIEPKAFTRVSSLGVEEQRVNVVLDISTPRETWRSLGDGYRIEAAIVVWQAADVLRVPASAVFRHDGSWSVYVVEESIAHLRAIELGQQDGFVAELISGLAEGDTVVVHPGDELSDGAEVVLPAL